MVLKAVVALCLTLPTLSGASAAEMAAPVDRSATIFELFDTNRDGVASVSEFENNKILLFDLWDRNHDHVLTPDETPLRPDAFQRSAGPDGKITPIEFIGIANDVFRAADTNHDGALDRQEFDALARKDFDFNAGARRVRRP